ncbi:MAG: Gfo/Idh/MocA family oxidoreductase [Bdellovibrionaceae bacterium]|nr:Gfo/Idh/MocA family oxidoreductase [Pseudobdellovibrionaceae bacterium]
MKIRSAVVGVGHLGRFHAQKHKMIDGVELVGVCDLNAEQADKVADELGVTAFHHPETLLGKIDAVTIAASTPAHYALVELFLKNKIHVLVEKPIASTSAEAEHLCKLSEENELKFQVGHVERFNPAFQSARAKISKPLFIECHRLAPFKVRSTEVDVVLDLMIHDLDVVLSLVQSEPTTVSAVGTPVLTKKLDIVNARIEFESGAVANLTASRVSQNSQRKFRIFQPDQYLSIDFQGGEVNLLTKIGEWSEGNIPLEHEQFNLEKGDALLEETRSFMEAIRTDGPVQVSGRDGLRALSLAERIIKNALDRLP